MEYIRTETVSRNALTATLFHLAERGLIDVRQTGENDWQIRGLADREAWDRVDPVSRTVGTSLKVDRAGAEFDADGAMSSGQRLVEAKTELSAAATDWAFDNGLMVSATHYVQWALRFLTVIAVAGAVAVTAGWVPLPTMWVLPLAGVSLLLASELGDGCRQSPDGRGSRVVPARGWIPSNAGVRTAGRTTQRDGRQKPLCRVSAVRGRRGIR